MSPDSGGEPARTGGALSAADWLDRGRVGRWGWGALVATVVSALVVIVSAYVLPEALDKRILPPDFAAFWAAGHLVLEGREAAVYDPEAVHAVQMAAIDPRISGRMAWLYPPHALPFVTGLGWLPVWWAMALFVAAGAGFFLWAAAHILPERPALVAALATAPTVGCIAIGQAGFFWGGLVALALVWRHRAPLLAGVPLAFMSVKPVLFAVLPLAYLAAGRWQALAAGAGLGLALMLAAGLLLGWDVWAAFFAQIGANAAHATGEGVNYSHYISIYGNARVLGLDPALGLALHLGVALPLLWMLVRAWREPGVAEDIRAALLCYAMIAAAPRTLYYEGHVLVVGALFQVRHALRAGFFPYEKTGLLAAHLVAFLSLAKQPGLSALLPHALFWGCAWGHWLRQREAAAVRQGDG
ncbi:MAG: glycosyltransferase family 87 protein [Pseudomonadota bacterium]